MFFCCKYIVWCITRTASKADVGNLYFHFQPWLLTHLENKYTWNIKKWYQLDNLTMKNNLQTLFVTIYQPTRHRWSALARNKSSPCLPIWLKSYKKWKKKGKKKKSISNLKIDCFFNLKSIFSFFFCHHSLSQPCLQLFLAAIPFAQPFHLQKRPKHLF